MLRFFFSLFGFLAFAPSLWAEELPILAQQAPRYVIDEVEVIGNERTSTELILAELLLQPGDLFEERLAELSRVKLFGTGLFAKISMRLKKGETRGHVILVIEVVERNTLLISDIFLTTSPQVPMLAGFGLVEENFLGHGLTLEGAFVAGSDIAGDLELSVRGKAESPRVGGDGFTLSATALYVSASDFFGLGEGREVHIEGQESPSPFARLRYQRAGGELGLGLELSSFSRLVLTGRLERLSANVPLAVSGPVGQAPDERVDFGILDGDSTLAALEALVIRDTRDHPFLPTRGTKLFFHGAVGAEVLGGSYNYGRFSVGVARWRRLPWGHILKGEAFVGLVLGDAPFFERFYIGDFSDLVPDRQLSLAPSAGDTPDLFSSGIDRIRYADFATRATLEYAVPLRKGKEGSYLYGMDAYIAGGLLTLANRQDLLVSDPERPYGVPFDLTLDVGLRVDTHLGIFGLSFSNAIGIVP